MGVWLAVVLGLLLAVPARASESTISVKDPNGKAMALLLSCNSCQPRGTVGRQCVDGVEEGWLDGKPCGKCMIEANYGARFVYPYDIHVAGKLVDSEGNPIKERFVKMFMANGWNVRSRTIADGSFRLMLGATAEREEKRPLLIDVGTRVDSPKENEAYYALFFLPDGYKLCPPTAIKASK